MKDNPFTHVIDADGPGSLGIKHENDKDAFIIFSPEGMLELVLWFNNKENITDLFSTHRDNEKIMKTLKNELGV